MSILVYSEKKEIALQLLSKSKELANELELELHAVEIQDFGLDKYAQIVYKNIDDESNFDSEGISKLIVHISKQTEPDYIIIGASKRGKEVAPRIAASLGVGCMTECNSLEIEKGKIIVERFTYGGSTIAREISHSKPTVISVPPRTFQIASPSYNGSIESVYLDFPKPRSKIVEVKQKEISDTGIENANVIVSAGRGFKDKKDLILLEELAEVLGAKIGCSRPISADQGWMKEWIGISGKKVKPKLYIACGISGTIQHIAGIRDSQIILSINNDESAGIKNVSDYSVIGDLYEFIPAFTRALKEQS
jgi:electron transfer flavoprotein alpha subunit